MCGPKSLSKKKEEKKGSKRKKILRKSNLIKKLHGNKNYFKNNQTE